ncbi:hypothetical protein [Melghirimyces profundicolus]|uniref:hypothetical protein n=1 Tax=Melghirimyces profundicolus TaxID=1242148 RepID=UPI001473827E|nr:hypothetical protein [Melghirimyces profundicolus]
MKEEKRRIKTVLESFHHVGIYFTEKEKTLLEAYLKGEISEDEFDRQVERHECEF